MSVRFLSACSTVVAILLGGFLCEAAEQPKQSASNDTRDESAKSRLVRRVYSVADLIVPRDDTDVPDATSPKNAPAQVSATTMSPEPQRLLPVCPASGATAGTSSTIAFAGRKPAPKTLEDQLMKMILRIKPESWADMGGPGTMDYYPLGMALVINQPDEVHKQIAELLAALRKLQDVEVTVEVRWVTVSDETLRRISKEIGFAGDDGKDKPDFCSRFSPAPNSPTPQVLAFLKDPEVQKLIEVVQGDAGASVMQAPKITMFNGQASTLNLTEQHVFLTGMDFRRQEDKTVFYPKNETIETGFQLNLQPVVSADGCFVQLKLKADMAELDPAPVPLFPVITMVTPVLEDGKKAEPMPFTQYLQQPKVNKLTLQKTLSIPDGGTALLAVGKKRQLCQNEVEPSILSRIPYLKELFRNDGDRLETVNLAMLITARTRRNEPQAITNSGVADVNGLPGPKTTAEPPRLVVDVENEDLVPVPRRIVPVSATVPVDDKPNKRTDLPYQYDWDFVFWQLDGAKTLDTQRKLADLRKEYEQACVAGRLSEAKRLVDQMMAIDPTCFSKLRADLPDEPFDGNFHW
jgi:general secretion pathway protein D